MSANIFMQDIIYLLCVEKERISGDSHFHPVVDVCNPDIDLICCNDLVALQNDNRDIINSLTNDCEVVTIVPVDLSIYLQLRDCLRQNIKGAQESLQNAYDALKKAYEIIGKEISMEQSVSETLTTLLGKNTSMGKCLDSNYNIVNCDSSYKEKYYDDFLEDEDYE